MADPKLQMAPVPTQKATVPCPMKATKVSGGTPQLCFVLCPWFVQPNYLPRESLPGATQLKRILTLTTLLSAGYLAGSETEYESPWQTLKRPTGKALLSTHHGHLPSFAYLATLAGKNSFFFLKTFLSFFSLVFFLKSLSVILLDVEDVLYLNLLCGPMDQA